jgi:uncharacterized radical SAM superfamily Fe-S cluster-containing enzyme
MVGYHELYARFLEFEKHGKKLFQVQVTFLDLVLKHSSTKRLSWKGQGTGSKEEKGKK